MKMRVFSVLMKCVLGLPFVPDDDILQDFEELLFPPSGPMACGEVQSHLY